MKNGKKIFRNRYNEIRSGWSIIPLIFLIIIGMLVSQAMLPEEAYRPVDQIVVTIIYGLLTVGGGLFLFKIFYNRGFKQMGVVKNQWLKELIHGFLIGTTATGLLFGIFMLIGEIKIISYDLKFLCSVVMLVEIFSLGVYVFVEEFLTRGYFMTALKTTRKNLIIFITSAVLFSFLHLLNEGATFLSTFNTFLAGLLLAYMFIKSGKLWIPTGFHFAWNFIQGTILGLTVSGNEQASVIVTKLGNNSLLLGGNYGPEGGLLVTAIILICFLYVKFVIKTKRQNIWTMENDLPLTR